MINNHLHKKYIVVFGSIFDNIYINKYSSENILDTDDRNKTLIKSIKVPINFSDKEKLILRYLRREVSLKGVKMTLPRLAFDIIDYTYDSERKLNKTHTIETKNLKTYTPVPYNLTFELSILSTKQSDNLKILEQILPHFAPHLKFSTKLLDGYDETFDLSVSLKNIKINDDNYKGDLKNERIITTSLFFNVKAWFFKTEEDTKVPIEKIYINYLDNDIEEEYIDESQTITEEDI